MNKTNAARLLDDLGIRYELREYEVDPNDLAAETVAAKIGLPPEQVFKTLLVRGAEPLFCVIPAGAELDLKAAARVSGNRTVDLAPVKDLKSLTGYVRGGVTVLAAKRSFPVFTDWTIELHDIVAVSAGQRGLQILLQPSDYIRATSATCGEIARPK
ncbi:MAG: Cys-tRNA(Pro) deacylase [Acidobacteriaceae bacterium]|nr:Cys-tRNA(Pro) deacylase [Acidobacteriaceae bacterium]